MPFAWRAMYVCVCVQFFSFCAILCRCSLRARALLLPWKTLTKQVRYNSRAHKTKNGKSKLAQYHDIRVWAQIDWLTILRVCCEDIRKRYSQDRWASLTHKYNILRFASQININHMEAKRSAQYVHTCVLKREDDWLSPYIVNENINTTEQMT